MLMYGSRLETADCDFRYGRQGVIEGYGERHRHSSPLTVLLNRSRFSDNWNMRKGPRGSAAAGAITIMTNVGWWQNPEKNNPVVKIKTLLLRELRGQCRGCVVCQR